MRLVRHLIIASTMLVGIFLLAAAQTPGVRVSFPGPAAAGPPGAQGPQGTPGIEGGGVGNAALAYVDAATIQIVDRDSGAAPSATNPVIVDVSGVVVRLTSLVTAAFPGSLDTGTEAVGTDYYAWLTLDSGAPVLKFSASKTAPTGLTSKRLLGACHNGPLGDLFSNSVWSLARAERDHEGQVKVGDGWVDIYESSVWTQPPGFGGTQKGASSDDYGCADTAADCTGLYAQSRYGVIPSRYLTWFQAARFAANSGRHLITDAEWQDQALGTLEVASLSVTTLTSVGTSATATITGHGYGAPGATRAVIINGAAQTEYNGAYTVTVSDANTVTYTFAGSATSPATGTITAQNRIDCIVNAAAPYGAGTATSCRSWANTYDNVGNLWEWTRNWWAGTLALASPVAESSGAQKAWSPLDDYVWNVRGAAYADGKGSGYADGIPAAGIRGGDWGSGSTAGVFSLNLRRSPWDTGSSLGFRCAGR